MGGAIRENSGSKFNLQPGPAVRNLPPKSGRVADVAVFANGGFRDIVLQIRVSNHMGGFQLLIGRLKVSLPALPDFVSVS